MSFTKIAVLGLGKVGTLAATLLREGDFEVTGIDARTRTGLPCPTATVDLASKPPSRRMRSLATLLSATPPARQSRRSLVRSRRRLTRCSRAC